MIKECPVIINNDALSVVRFDDIDIQFPSVGKNVKSVNVEFDGKKYSIVKNIDDKQLIEVSKEKAEPETIDNAKKTEKKTRKTIRKKRETIVKE